MRGGSVDNVYWKNSRGQVAKSESESLNQSLLEMGWVRITRREYRKLVKSGRPADDHRAQGEQANEVDE